MPIKSRKPETSRRVPCVCTNMSFFLQIKKCKHAPHIKKTFKMPHFNVYHETNIFARNY